MAEDYFAEQYHSLNLLTFNVGICHFATQIEQIEQIIILREIRKIPNVPKLIEGVFDMNNRIVIVIDLRKVFQLESTADEDIKVIICMINNTLIGFIVDDVSQVVQKPQTEIKMSPPPVIRGLNPDCIYGMVDGENQHVLLVDFEKILTKKESEIIAQVDSKSI